MILTVYGAWDNLAHNFITFTVTPKNDGLAVRNVLSTLRVPLKDTQMVALGEFDPDIGFHSFKSSIRSIDWSVYKFLRTLQTLSLLSVFQKMNFLNVLKM